MRQGRGALFIAAIALLAAGAWLARPEPRGEGGEATLAPLRVLLVDASASVTGGTAGVGWRRWATRALFDEARAAQSEREDVAVVLYADEVRRAFGPAPASDLLDRLTGADGRAFELSRECREFTVQLWRD